MGRCYKLLELVVAVAQAEAEVLEQVLILVELAQLGLVVEAVFELAKVELIEAFGE